MVEAPAARLPLDDRSLLAWALGTFHTVLLVLVLLIALHNGGGLGGAVDGLNTLLGFVIFGALWLTAWWSTRRVLRAVVSAGRLRVSTWRLLQLGALWGGFSGVLFLLSLVVIIATVSIPAIVTALGDADVSDIPVGVTIVLVYGPFGTVVAFVLGAVVGIALALIDRGLLAMVNLSGGSDAGASGR